VERLHEGESSLSVRIVENPPNTDYGDEKKRSRAREDKESTSSRIRETKDSQNPLLIKIGPKGPNAP